MKGSEVRKRHVNGGLQQMGREAEVTLLINLKLHAHVECEPPECGTSWESREKR